MKIRKTSEAKPHAGPMAPEQTLVMLLPISSEELKVLAVDRDRI
jgi:hypothetical protein